MAIDKARDHLKNFHMEDRIKEFATSAATVELAAQNLGCEPARIAKTMSFLINEQPILIVLAGDTKIDNAKYKATFHIKAKMIHPEDVERIIGHKPGSVCPFGINKGITVYLDNSLKRFETVFPSCGGINSAIEMTISELEKCSNYQEWIDVGKENI